MPSLSRILAVTAGLALLGALAGALAGAIVAMTVGLITGGLFDALDLELAQIGAAIGAPLGGVLLPIAGWLSMRRVSLGRATLGTALGTIVGGTVGWFTPIGQNELTRSLAGAVIGFIVAVLVLRRTAPLARAQSS